MLYTFAKSDYSAQQLQYYLAQCGEKDAVLLWQDGVLLALKYPQLLADCYVLDIDAQARNILELLPSKVRLVSLMDLVHLTEQYYPQLSL